MTDFNMWTWNSRVFPGIDPLVARTGDRVRIRIGNLTMTNHPIHMHGPHFEVTGTDGGWVRQGGALAGGDDRHRRSGRCAPSSSTRSPATGPSTATSRHHTMNAMGHNVPTMIGVDHRGLAERITKLVPDYMVMGDKGMHDMAEMEMPLPDNTLPMMTGKGPFGPVGMGGMFSVVKVRDDVQAGRLQGPRSVQAPAGHRRLRVHGPAARARARRSCAPGRRPDLHVRQPSGHSGH